MKVTPVSSVQYYGIQNNKINFTSSPTKNQKSKHNTNLMIGLGVLGAVGIATVAIATKNTKQTKKLGFKDFQYYAQKAELHKPEDFMLECAEQNIIGKGANSTVYEFSNPLMDKWVIKVDTSKPNHKDSFFQPLKEVVDEFAGKNMGQEIARFGEHVHILNRINGKAHSIANWSQHRANQTPFTPAEAEKFLSDTQKIAQFPQRSFDKFAERLKLLDNKGYKADSFNPNNYLIDYSGKNIFIIDAYKYNVDAHMNTKYDLIGPLIDYPNFEKYYNVMNDTQKKAYIKTTETIAKKCTKAAENADLPTTESMFTEFISRIDARENNGNLYTNNYNAMKNICKDIKI